MKKSESPTFSPGDNSKSLASVLCWPLLQSCAASSAAYFIFSFLRSDQQEGRGGKNPSKEQESEAHGVPRLCHHLHKEVYGDGKIDQGTALMHVVQEQKKPLSQPWPGFACAISASGAELILTEDRQSD